MDIYIYSDESGVLDKAHNTHFTFGGILFLSKEARDIASRKYSKAENSVRLAEKLPSHKEVKANAISNKSKGKLFRSLNQEHKFGIVITQRRLLNRIFESKQSKQRYLDFAYKLALKAKLVDLIDREFIDPSNVENIYVFVDEHTTATNGRYELQDGLKAEFKDGTFNYNYLISYPPIFPKLKSLQVQFCNSETTLLIRAADIIANKLFHAAHKNTVGDLVQPNFKITLHP